MDCSFDKSELSAASNGTGKYNGMTVAEIVSIKDDGLKAWHIYSINSSSLLDLSARKMAHCKSNPCPSEWSEETVDCRVPGSKSR